MFKRTTLRWKDRLPRILFLLVAVCSASQFVAQILTVQQYEARINEIVQNHDKYISQQQLKLDKVQELNKEQYYRGVFDTCKNAEITIPECLDLVAKTIAFRWYEADSKGWKWPLVPYNPDIQGG